MFLVKDLARILQQELPGDVLVFGKREHAALKKMDLSGICEYLGRYAIVVVEEIML